MLHGVLPDGANTNSAENKFQRLASEACEPGTLSELNWRADAEVRTGPSGTEQAWLHLVATAVLPLICQRCLTSAPVTVAADRWFRFVADEATAMAEDDICDEDLLVLQPQFNLMELVEDELIMSLPLVPMHEHCPVVVRSSVGEEQMSGAERDRPHPFAALSALKAAQKS